MKPKFRQRNLSQKYKQGLSSSLWFKLYFLACQAAHTADEVFTLDRVMAGFERLPNPYPYQGMRFATVFHQVPCKGSLSATSFCAIPCKEWLPATLLNAIPCKE